MYDRDLDRIHHLDLQDKYSTGEEESVSEDFPR